MLRRRFLQAMAAAPAAPMIAGRRAGADDRTFASPAAARSSPRETLAYVVATRVGTGVDRPDYLATIDLDPASPTASKVVHRLPMPNVGDELHHSGWNACASCHGARARRHLILPGLTSGRIHVVDTADPRRPSLHAVIEPAEVAEKAGLTGPHTVHCLESGQILVSMLGDRSGDAPGGFLLLDPDFKVAGRWEAGLGEMKFNYDFWYQPRQNVMVSSEWAAPKTIRPGFRPSDVAAGRYGRRLHFWDWERRTIAQTIDLGDDGQIPLEVRFHHDPESTHGFVGAALSSSIWHYFKAGDAWKAEKVVQVDPVTPPGGGPPLPGLITDLVLSLDDRWLYFSDWLHGDVRQYDVSDPSRPRLAGQAWLGGLLGKGPTAHGRPLAAGPQMLQLSLDGRRLYVTDSLYSAWDDQFYPGLAKAGSTLLRLDCDTDRGGLSLDPRFLVDFGLEPDGPVRAHEVRFPGGDSTSDIWT